MNVAVGNILVMKKEHPCGSKRWSVMKLGMDLRLKCEGCGREVILPRRKAESSVCNFGERLFSGSSRR